MKIIHHHLLARHVRTVRRTLTTAGLLVLAGGCTVEEPAEPAVVERGIGLRAFDACEPLLDYFHDEALSYLEMGMNRGGFVEDVALGAEPPRANGANDEASGEAQAAGGGEGPRAGGQDFSETNIQERGVDEQYIIKTDC